MGKVVRMDKWLWAMRLCKTRSDAADACRTSKVQINGTSVKPSRQVDVGDRVSVRRGHITYSYKVIELMDRRQAASEISKYMEDVTPQKELDKLDVPRETIFVSRDRGAGAPSKRDRRQMDDLMDQMRDYDPYKLGQE